MKNNIKNYILLLLHFFYICYFIYSNKEIGNESYIKLLSFLSFEILWISIFFYYNFFELFWNNLFREFYYYYYVN